MRLLIYFLVIYSSFFVTFCSNCKEAQNGNNKSQEFPTAITQNLSKVTAEVIGVIGSGNNFKVEVKVIDVQETDSYPSIAVSGEEYTLTPNLRTENGKLLDNDVNSNLLSLRNLSKGQKFNAEISLDQKSGWLIQKVIK